MSGVAGTELSSPRCAGMTFTASCYSGCNETRCTPGRNRLYIQIFILLKEES